MNFEQFAKYQEQLLQKVIDIGNTKGKEYAHNPEDRFANFNRLAERTNQKNLQVAYVYLAKHMDGIESFIASGRTFSEERPEGRIVDAICYLTLIAGMIEESRLSEMRANDFPKGSQPYISRGLASVENQINKR